MAERLKAVLVEGSVPWRFADAIWDKLNTIDTAKHEGDWIATYRELVRAVWDAWPELSAMSWRPIAEAPRDGTQFIAYSWDVHGHGGDDPFPPFVSLCAWHPDAGFCTDELREPTHWLPYNPPQP